MTKQVSSFVWRKSAGPFAAASVPLVVIIYLYVQLIIRATSGTLAAAAAFLFYSNTAYPNIYPMFF
jgi:hypothetical protein